MTAHTLDSLCGGASNSLARHYREFRVGERLLLTGHSHQAWPDCAREGFEACFRDAAELVDDKWERAFAKAERVREGYRALLGHLPGPIVLGQSTHELLVRLFSAWPLRERPRLVTSDAEFHSLRRQLDRLAEEGLEIVRVPAAPVETLAERLAVELRRDAARTSAVLVSSVLFTTSEIVPNLAQLARACEHEGVALVLDAYHQLGVVPFDATGLERAFVVGGGYKYCQLGEGNCFLRIPEHAALRPVITGWFAEFGTLSGTRDTKRVAYAEGPLGFAGSTYDPVSHYRAARVLDFFAEQGLDVALLRRVSQHQVGLLRSRFLALDLDPARIKLASDAPLSAVGGFLALHTPHASELVKALATRGVHTDARGDILRLGPAPYLTDAQLHQALDAVADTCTR